LDDQKNQGKKISPPQPTIDICCHIKKRGKKNKHKVASSRFFSLDGNRFGSCSMPQVHHSGPARRTSHLYQKYAQLQKKKKVSYGRRECAMRISHLNGLTAVY
jgi:hypothetical protein